MKLHLEFHHDECYRISLDATDHWIGLLCDKDGEERVDFSSFIAENGFACARKLAENFAAESNKGGEE